jgi:hypothetical protein
MQSSSDRSQQKADADCSFEYRCKPRFALATAWLSHAVGMHVLLRSRQMTGRNFITCEAEEANHFDTYTDMPERRRHNIAQTDWQSVNGPGRHVIFPACRPID